MMDTHRSLDVSRGESGLQSGVSDSVDGVLILGATGFVGTQLAHHLLKQGEKLRFFVRSPSRLDPRLQAKGEVIVGDLTWAPDRVSQSTDLQMQPTSGQLKALVEACAGVKTVYYLVHGLELQGAEFEAQEVRQVEGFLQALALLPKEKRPRKIIYLGGLIPVTSSRIGPEGSKQREAPISEVSASDGQQSSKVESSLSDGLSKHLRSRGRVGQLLRGGCVPVVELQASIVLGAGSLSFELMRALTLRLPILPKTEWSQANCQPISLKDLLEILTAAHQEEGWPSLVQIGGPEKVTYFELLSRVAKAQHLIRPVLPLPGISVELSAELMALIVPEFAEVGKKLLESIEIETILTATGPEVRVGRLRISEAMRDAFRASESLATKQTSVVGASLDLSTPLGRMAFRRGQGGAIQQEAFFFPDDWLEGLRKVSPLVAEWWVTQNLTWIEPFSGVLGGWSEKVWGGFLERLEKFLSDDSAPQMLDLPLLGKLTRLKNGRSQGRPGTWILVRFAPRNFLSACALGLGGAIKARIESR